MARKSVSKTPLGQRLSEVREARGFSTRAAFAEYLGMNSETLGGYERGDSEPDVAFLAMYRERFGINLVWLITGEGEMFEESALTAAREAYGQSERGGDAKGRSVEPDVLVRIANTVRLAHDEAGVKLPRNSDLRPIADFYNDFVTEGIDFTDEKELEARLLLLKNNLKRMLRRARAEPGTGKRLA